MSHRFSGNRRGGVSWRSWKGRKERNHSKKDEKSSEALKPVGILSIQTTSLLLLLKVRLEP